jgi:putative protease
MTDKIELLAPAGDLEKLKIAVAYGADAVYIGGQKLGLRAKAKNFDDAQLKEGITFAHENNARVYITANVFAHNDDFDGIADYFVQLQKLGADALIISDPGVFSVAREVVPEMEVHISTQANNTNYRTALFWQKLGAERIVLARELSFKEIAEIKAKANGMKLEAFVHGAMCISYSGRCLLSNYMANRDANQGACAHPCRWKYHLVEEKRPGEYLPIEEDDRGTYIYNSKDLCMIDDIPALIQSGIDSFKIEGRMKTPYYVGTVIKAYRTAIDDFYNNPEIYEHNRINGSYVEALIKSSHRDFTTGFYYGKPDGNEQVYTNNTYVRNYEFIGMVLEYDPESKIATIEQRNKFSVGEEIEILSAKGNDFAQTVDGLWNKDGEAIDSAPHPQQIIRLKVNQPVKQFDMLRKRSDS